MGLVFFAITSPGFLPTFGSMFMLPPQLFRATVACRFKIKIKVNPESRIAPTSLAFPCYFFDRTAASGHSITIDMTPNEPPPTTVPFGTQFHSVITFPPPRWRPAPPRNGALHPGAPKPVAGAILLDLPAKNHSVGASPAAALPGIHPSRVKRCHDSDRS